MNGPAARSNASKEVRCAIAIPNSAGPSVCATRFRISSPMKIKKLCAGGASAPSSPAPTLPRVGTRAYQEHWSGVVAFLKTRLTNGAIEAVNGLLQLAKRLARGFRSLRYFRIMAYLQSRRSSSRFAVPCYPLRIANGRNQLCSSDPWASPHMIGTSGTEMWAAGEWSQTIVGPNIGVKG